MFESYDFGLGGYGTVIIKLIEEEIYAIMSKLWSEYPKRYLGNKVRYKGPYLCTNQTKSIVKARMGDIGFQ